MKLRKVKQKIKSLKNLEMYQNLFLILQNLPETLIFNQKREKKSKYIIY